MPGKCADGARQVAKWWDSPTICEAKRRVILPVGKLGDRFDVEFSSDGRMIFTRLEPVKPTVSHIRKNGLLLAATDVPISWEEKRKVMDELS